MSKFGNFHWVQPFRPAHNLIRPPPRSFLPSRRRIHNSVVHQRRSPLPCRRSILLRRSASLHRSRTAAPGRARGLALLRNRQRCLRGLSFIFFFLSGFSFFPCFSSFSSRHLVFVLKIWQKIWQNLAKPDALYTESASIFRSARR